MASDLRFLVSVVRILSELERVGDLALRVIKLAPEVEELSDCGPAWDIVRTLVDVAVEQYRTALRAWSAQDLGAGDPARRAPPAASSRSTSGWSTSCGASTGPTRWPSPCTCSWPGQAADRIADHAAIIGARLRYLLTGEAAHLVAEVR